MAAFAGGWLAAGSHSNGGTHVAPCALPGGASSKEEEALRQDWLRMAKIGLQRALALLVPWES